MKSRFSTIDIKATLAEIRQRYGLFDIVFCNFQQLVMLSILVFSSLDLNITVHEHQNVC